MNWINWTYDKQLNWNDVNNEHGVRSMFFYSLVSKERLPIELGRGPLNKLFSKNLQKEQANKENNMSD